MSIELIRGLYDYHRWAHRLFEIAVARGDEDTGINSFVALSSGWS
jgi:hypothetical protein